MNRISINAEVLLRFFNRKTATLDPNDLRKSGPRNAPWALIDAVFDATMVPPMRDGAVGSARGS